MVISPSLQRRHLSHTSEAIWTAWPISPLCSLSLLSTVTGGHGDPWVTSVTPHLSCLLCLVLSEHFPFLSVARSCSQRGRQGFPLPFVLASVISACRTWGLHCCVTKDRAQGHWNPLVCFWTHMILWVVWSPV